MTRPRSRMQDRVVDLDGPVHYADFGGEGRPIVLVHGLGGSHLNWLPVAPRLAARGRVVAVDLFGHGRTPSLGRTARVSANTRMLVGFLDAVAGAPAVLMGNSMGGYLSLAVAAAQPEKVRAVVLVNAAVPLARARLDPRFVVTFAGMALPVVGEALLHARWRRGPERMVKDLLSLCYADPSRISQDVLDAHVALATERSGLGRVARRDFLAAQRSLMSRLLRRRRFFEMIATIRAPVLIVQGDRDRLVQLAAARALVEARPEWRLEVLDGVGHVPQLETPERFLAIVEPWLRRIG